MRELKVLHVCHTLNTGGLERIILEMARRGREHGFASWVATLGPGGGLAQELVSLGGHWRGLAKREGLDWRTAPRLMSLAKSMGADVIHGHNEGASLYAGLAGRLSGRPAICTRHGLSFGAGPKGVWLRRTAGWLCRRTVCVGGKVLAMARHNDRLPAARLALIYNGVDARVFAPDQEARSRCRQRLGIDPGRPAVISVGRLVPEKDYALLLRAIASLRVDGMDVCLLLVGNGRERQGLADLAGRLGLAESAFFLGERREVPDLLNAADVFALSSLSEGVPMAMLEAMSCGLPVVSTAVGGAPEVVEHGSCGLLVGSRQPRELAAALHKVLADQGAARRMGMGGRIRVLERFSLDAMLSAYAGLYRRLAGGRA